MIDRRRDGGQMQIFVEQVIETLASGLHGDDVYNRGNS